MENVWAQMKAVLGSGIAFTLLIALLWLSQMTSTVPEALALSYMSSCMCIA